MSVIVPAWQIDRVALFHGDCVEVMKGLGENSVDAVVCDPPYALSFMGKSWDHFEVPGGVGADRDFKAGATGRAHSHGIANHKPMPFQTWCEAWAREALRVLKPGGHLLAFGGSRTYHRLACAIEDAGFEIRDSLMWCYGTGFPKSLNLGDGRGTALKPAYEPIVLARKALDGTVAANVAKWGTGALNIDACRIATEDNLNGGAYSPGIRPNGLPGDDAKRNAGVFKGGVERPLAGQFQQPEGRWPANLVLDEEAGVLLDMQSGTRSPGHTPKSRAGSSAVSGPIGHSGQEQVDEVQWGKGGASRFFYSPKTSRTEREEGLAHLPARTGAEAVEREEGSAGTKSPRAGAGRTARGGQVLDPTKQVLYPSAAWVFAVLDRTLPVDTAQSLRRATVGSTIRCNDGSVWSMCWCGSPSTDPCRPAIRSIIGTKTSWTTESKTWLPSPRLHTNGCMADAFGVVAVGGSPVGFADR